MNALKATVMVYMKKKKNPPLEGKKKKKKSRNLLKLLFTLKNIITKAETAS